MGFLPLGPPCGTLHSSLKQRPWVVCGRYWGSAPSLGTPSPPSLPPSARVFPELAAETSKDPVWIRCPSSGSPGLAPPCPTLMPQPGLYSPRV